MSVKPGHALLDKGAKSCIITDPPRYGHLVSEYAAAQNRAPFPQGYLPGLWVLRKHQRSWLRGDLLAGVTVAAYLVPQVMAYPEVAGLLAITGR